MNPTTAELAAQEAVFGAGGCQFAGGWGFVSELAAQEAVFGVGGCQFDLRAGAAT